MLRHLLAPLTLTVSLFVTLVEVAPALGQDDAAGFVVASRYIRQLDVTPTAETPMPQVTEVVTPEANDESDEAVPPELSASPSPAPTEMSNSQTVTPQATATPVAAQDEPQATGTTTATSVTATAPVTPMIEDESSISLTLAATPTLNKLAFPVDFVSTTQTLTLTVEDLSPALSTDEAVLYTATVPPGVHAPYTVTLSADAVPYQDTNVQVALYSPFTTTAVATATAQLNVPERIIVFDVESVQTGDGKSLIIDHLVIGQTYTPTVYLASGVTSAPFDINEQLASMPALQAGRYVDYEITLPSIEQDQELYIGLVQAKDGKLAGPPKGVSLHVTPVVRSSNFFSPTQVGDGTLVALTGLTVTQAVTLELLTSGSSVTDTQVLITQSVSAGHHEAITLPIPVAVQPISSTLYTLRIVGTDPVTTVLEAPIEVKLLPVLSVNIQGRQRTDGKALTITQMHLGQSVTVTLDSDAEGISANDQITQFVYSPGVHSSVQLTIPEGTRPTTDTVYWIGFHSVEEMPVPEPIRVEAILPNSERQTEIVFDVAGKQSGDGRALQIRKIDTIDSLSITVHTDLDGKPNLDDIVGQTVVAGADYVDEWIEIAADRQPVTDTVYWLIASPVTGTAEAIERDVAYDFDPQKVLPEFEMEGTQSNDGSEVIVQELHATRPVTVLLALSKAIMPNTVPLREMQLAPDLYTDFAVSIPVGRQPVTNTTVWVHVLSPGGLPAAAPKRVQLLINPPAEPLRSTASIAVSNQDSGGYSIVFDKVVATQDSWLLVYQAGDTDTNNLVGYARVPRGETPNFQFAFTEGPLSQGSILNAILHQDTGKQGVMEFPNADPPVMGKDGAVNASFVLGRPAVQTGNQTTFGDSVRIDQVISPQDGWIVVYDSTNSDVLGHLQVPRGLNRDLVVPMLSTAITGEVPLNVALHTDAGIPSVFEFPSPDSVVLDDGTMVSQPISVTIVPRPASANGIFNGDYVQLIQSRIVIDRVVTPEDSWLVLFCNSAQAKDLYCGHTHLLAGEHTDVEVVLLPPGEINSTVRAVLYQDLGMLNALELKGPDVPLLVDGVAFETTFELPPPLNASPLTGANLAGNTLRNGLMGLVGIALPLLFAGLNRFV